MTAHVDVQVVLDWLKSEFRVELNDLPKGLIGESGACPIASALHENGHDDDLVDEIQVYCAASGDHELPYDVSQWLQGFDKGMYPQYVQEGDK